MRDTKLLGEQPPVPVSCPYCNADALLVSSTVVYGGRNFGMIYVCSNFPTCDARVGAHKANNQPLGTMADASLRRLRMMCHRLLDTPWKSGLMSRNAVYRRAATLMGMKFGEFHVSSLDESGCRKFIGIWREPV